MIFQKLLRLNFLFLFIVSLIAIIGFFALYSAANGNFDPWTKKQILRFFISFILLIIVSVIDIKLIFKYSYIFFTLSLFLLASVEIAGTFGFGAKRWIHFFGISIQPSEIIKIAIIIALAKYYHNLRFENITKVTSFFLPLIIILIPFYLVLSQPDLGTAIMILLLGTSLMFFVGIRIWKFILVFIISIGSLPVLWNLLKSYQQKRVIAFLNPELDPLGTGYHLTQSKIALGSGGLTGKGYLQGTQSYLEYLPEKQTDFIFTLIGEEFGFLGTIFLLTLFILLIILSYLISYKSNNLFGKIISIGVSLNLFLYVFFNTAMVTGIIPVVGVPLPLVSYGGTALLSIMLSFGLLMNANINSDIKKLE
tara:strand:- start:49 stop:1143 length:1095 start_codon:yes stop_codon:yes gene_type:complete